jgi:hypothetical protein
MTQETETEKVRRGIIQVLSSWGFSKAIAHISEDMGLGPRDDLEFALAPENSDHVFQVSVGEGYYKVKIQLEEWE